MGVPRSSRLRLRPDGAESGTYLFRLCLPVSIFVMCPSKYRPCFHSESSRVHILGQRETPPETAIETLLMLAFAFNGAHALIVRDLDIFLMIVRSNSKLH